MRDRLIYALVSALFLSMLAFSTLKDIQHDRYVRDTLKRDAAQEQCAREVVGFITAWAAVRDESEPVFALNARLSQEINTMTENGLPVPRDLYDRKIAAEGAVIEQHHKLGKVIDDNRMDSCPR